MYANEVLGGTIATLENRLLYGGEPAVVLRNLTDMLMLLIDSMGF